jgi:serine/threonine protein kinase
MNKIKIGNYTLLKKISEGSFGRTYFAEHSILKSKVCIKEEITENKIYQDWFREEARLLWDICHPSLPTLKDYFESPDQVMVMSFILGDSLDKVVEKHGFIDDEHLCWILQRCLDAMSYLHYKGIVHCDIKPQNIILNTKEHNAILVDFGLSAVKSGANTKPKGGTEFYLPPEFELGKPPIPASDIYSLGKVAVFLAGGNPATGSLPYINDSLKELIYEMIRHDPMHRPSDARELSEKILELRKKQWGRVSTLEEIKFK